MLIFLEACLLLLAFLDAEFTKRKLSELGVEVELNPVIRGLSRLLGIRIGVDLGIVLPTGALAIVGWYHPWLLLYVLGVRSCLFLFQLRVWFGA
jgi:hypothetical protein